MKRSKYTESQVIFALRQPPRSPRSAERLVLARRPSIPSDREKKKYGGLGTSELPRLRQLDEENNRLKKLVADLSLDKHMLQEVLKKKV